MNDSDIVELIVKLIQSSASLVAGAFALYYNRRLGGKEQIQSSIRQIVWD
jgi:hypothetical protein